MKCVCCNKKYNNYIPANFHQRMSFRFNGKEFPFQFSDLCSDCRHQRRLAFRNEQSLYHRTSAVSGEKILSLYHPTPLWGEPYKVMLESEWRADSFNPKDYGREIDFSRPFFEQYAELHKSVPRMSIVNLANENSPYTSHTGYSKNCYMLPCSEHCEDCYYGRFLQKCKNCVDCTSVIRSELCYESFQLTDCYDCAFLSLSENCSNCYYSENLIGCSNCLFCTNLRRAEYMIYNNRVTPEEFKSFKDKIFSSSDEMEIAYKEWEKIRLGRARRPSNIRNCENSAGDFLRDSKNCTNCTDVTGGEDCSDIIIGYNLKDCHSCCNFYLSSELNYEILGSTELYHCAFGFYVFRSQDVLYSEYIYDSKRLFGCVGMTRGENCILNREYPQKDYEILASKLAEHMERTGEWGKQLPTSVSPFGYNETVAADLFPLTKEEALKKGFLWRDLEESERVKPTKKAPPTEFCNYSRELLNEIYPCKTSGVPFKFISAELDFYSKFGLALPRISPRTRHQRRELLRFPASFYKSRCVKCSASIDTNVPETFKSTLHCEECFQDIFN